MLKITRTTLLEGFHDSPFLWVPINWSNIALIWSEADILGPGCQSEIKASDITTCPKIPPNSGADDSKPITKLFYHICLLWREIILLSLNAKSDQVDATWQLKQARAAAIVDHRLFWLLFILMTRIFPPKKWFKRENTKDHNWGNLGAGRCCRGPSSVDSLQVGFATSTTLGRWRRHFFCFYKHRRCS